MKIYLQCDKIMYLSKALQRLAEIEAMNEGSAMEGR